jgi:hypothetical protein
MSNDEIKNKAEIIYTCLVGLDLSTAKQLLNDIIATLDSKAIISKKN